MDYGWFRAAHPRLLDNDPRYVSLVSSYHKTAQGAPLRLGVDCSVDQQYTPGYDLLIGTPERCPALTSIKPQRRGDSELRRYEGQQVPPPTMTRISHHDVVYTRRRPDSVPPT